MTHHAQHRIEGVLLAAVLFVIGLLWSVAVWGHDIYTPWMIPGTLVSCCDKRDCRPTRARMDDNEQWEAWDGHRWVKVPPERVLKFPSPDGRSHLCEGNGSVFCFVPGEVRS